MTCVGLVLAKAPVAGKVKTRLGATVGPDAAAELAAASLLDCLEVCAGAFEARVLAVEGDLAAAVRARETTAALASWTVLEQRGDHFGQRLENAHVDAAAARRRPVVQVGMDTPQMRVDDLAGVAAALREHDAALAPAEDGGWWALGVTHPAWVRGICHVPMSTGSTGTATHRLLVDNGARVALAGTLRDVDTVEDAHRVAAAAPGSRFAHAWGRCGHAMVSAR